MKKNPPKLKEVIEELARRLGDALKAPQPVPIPLPVRTPVRRRRQRAGL